MFHDGMQSNTHGAKTLDEVGYSCNITSDGVQITSSFVRAGARFVDAATRLTAGLTKLTKARSELVLARAERDSVALERARLAAEIARDERESADQSQSFMRDLLTGLRPDGGGMRWRNGFADNDRESMSTRY